MSGYSRARSWCWLAGRRRQFSTAGGPAVPLTASKHPGLTRGRYATLTDGDLSAFERICPGGVLTQDIEGHNTDWLRTVRGQSQCVLRPKETGQVAELVKYCNERRIAVCPQGGNTGLVGGSVPVFDEVIISTQLMNKIEDIDAASGVVVSQAGVVLEQLDSQLEEHGLMVPLDLGAKGSCHIGGNVSTNAGGLRLLRYGSLHGSVLGLEVVLPTGKVLDCLSTLKKDNTGYDLKQIFIGAEGTLGLVTRVSLACPPRPRAINVALLSLDQFDSVLKTFTCAKTRLGEILSSCEFVDADSMECVTRNLRLTCPLQKENFYMLLETSGSNSDHDEEKLGQFLEFVMTEGLVRDGTVAASPSKQREVWQLRERLAEALLHDGYCYKYDISLPLSAFYQAVLTMRERLGNDVIRCVGYGHIGDCNLHLNMTTQNYSQHVMDKIEPFLYEFTSKHRGSISAEHGVGFKKRNYIHFSKSPEAIEIMKQMKNIFDPNGIMNPYKVIPDY